MPPDTPAPPRAPVAGATEMHARVAALDWAATPLGPPDAWPPALRTAVAAALEMRFSACLWVGPEFVAVYNDAYTRLLGAKHPAALGRPGREVWAEVWGQLEPLYAGVRDGGPSLYGENAAFLMERRGVAPPEEAWFDYSVSAVRDEEDRVVAVLNVGIETTARVLADRAADAARREAELHAAHLRDAFDAAPQFVAMLRGPDMIYEYVNEAYRRFTGRRAEAGQRMWDVLPDARDQGFEELLLGVLDSGEPFVGREIPAMLEVVPGSPPQARFMDLVFQPLTEADGRRERIVVIGTDVTEQVNARRAVEAANEELREQAAELEVINEELQEQTAELEASNEELRTTADALAEARDAVEAERESLAQVIAQLPLGVAVYEGPDLRVRAVSDAYTAMVGGRRMAGRTAREALPDLEDGERFFAMLDNVFATGEPVRGTDVPVTWDADGDGVPEPHAVDFVYAPVRGQGEDGPVTQVIAAVAEVTERAQAQARLRESEARFRAAAEAEREARREAEAANRAKSEFLAVMSHELRTPLNAIGGYAELLELGIRGAVTPEQREDIARIRRSQQHLLGLINEVLNYARIEAGMVRYENAPVRLAEVVASVEPLVAPLLAGRALSYVAEDCADGLTALADREKVRQVLLNLLGNAVKFTEPGGRVTVACGRAGPGFVRVSVQDTGVGIAPDQLERVFEPFVQVNASLTRTAEGTGLGLAISRDLARGMGGDLTAESQFGAGSTFTLRLPAA